VSFQAAHFGSKEPENPPELYTQSGNPIRDWPLDSPETFEEKRM
jgi:hypothetical protein